MPRMTIAALIGGILIMASCASTASAADTWGSVSRDALTCAVAAEPTGEEVAGDVAA